MKVLWRSQLERIKLIVSTFSIVLTASMGPGRVSEDSGSEMASSPYSSFERRSLISARTNESRIRTNEQHETLCNDNGPPARHIPCCTQAALCTTGASPRIHRILHAGRTPIKERQSLQSVFVAYIAAQGHKCVQGWTRGAVILLG